jgi:hypothetical protein
MKIQFKDICSGIYNAKISNIIEKSGPYGSYWRFNFTILEGELQGWSFYGIVKPYPVKQSKFYRWIFNIMKGKPYENISINDLIGKECRIIVNEKTKKNKTYYYVKDLADPF